MSRFEIKTDRLRLVPNGPEFLDSTNEYALDYETAKYMMHLPNENSEETLEFLKYCESEWTKDSPEAYEFAILFEGVHIGGLCLYPDDGSAEIGWILNKKYQKRGFALEAARALIDYYVSNFGIRHFYAHCDTENEPSYKLMEKLGMTRTCTNSGRKNRSSSKESFEYQYELFL